MSDLITKASAFHDAVPTIKSTPSAELVKTHVRERRLFVMDVKRARRLLAMTLKNITRERRERIAQIEKEFTTMYDAIKKDREAMEDVGDELREDIADLTDWMWQCIDAEREAKNFHTTNPDL